MKYLKYFRESIHEEYDETIKIKVGDIFRFTHPDPNIISIFKVTQIPELSLISIYNSLSKVTALEYKFVGFTCKLDYTNVEKNKCILGDFAVSKDDIPTIDDINHFFIFSRNGNKDELLAARKRRNEMEVDFKKYQATQRFYL